MSAVTPREGRRVVVAVTALMIPILLGGTDSRSPHQNLPWAVSLGGSFADDRSYGIVVDNRGDVYTTGHFQGTADFDPGPGVYNLTSVGNNDVYLSKLGADATFVWAKRIGGYGADYSSSVAVDRSGNVYATGVFHGIADFDPDPELTYNLDSLLGNADVFIVKLDTDGNFLWAKRLGGVVDDVGASVAVDGSSSVYVTGRFRGKADFDPDPEEVFTLISVGGSEDDIFVAKLDAGGDFVWARRMGGNYSDVGTSIAVDPAGNVYSTGSFSGVADFDPGPGTHELNASINVSEVFVSKLDRDGNYIWARGMGGTEPDVASCIAVDDRGDAYTTGSFQGTTDFDPRSDATYDLTSAGSSDIFVSKLDRDGVFVWARGMGGMQEDWGSSIAVDPAGNVYTTGAFVAAADFDPGPGTYNIRARFRDVFVSKIDAEGNFVWVKGMGGSSDDGGTFIAVDQRDGVFTTGYFSGTADFDPEPPTHFLTSSGRRDAFVSKFTSSVQGRIGGD